MDDPFPAYSLAVLHGLLAFDGLPELDVVDEVIFVDGLQVGTPGHGTFDVLVPTNHFHDRIPFVRMTAVGVLDLELSKKSYQNDKNACRDTIKSRNKKHS